METLRNAWQWFVKALFPPKCLVCYREGCFLCAKHQKLPPAPLSKVHFKNLIKVEAVTAYQDPVVKKIVENFKFHGVADLGEFMATKIAEKKQDFLENAILVPIPLHWSRKIWRGFNQSEVLARQISRKISNARVVNLLKRVKRTQQQAKLSKIERAKNTQNAFTLTKNFAEFAEQKIVLIDDVVASGATLEAAALVLKKVGFKNIFALTFARSGVKLTKNHAKNYSQVKAS